MNCIIIDDEKHCIKTLSNLLKKNFTEVNIIATCSESPMAYDLIQQYKPDFIFLDIEMPLLNGFDLLSKFDPLFFDVIFTTAYDSYAIKAIKYSALDYLLKPVDKEDLAFAVEKLKSKHNSISKEQLQMATAVQNKQMPDTIALPTSDGLTFASVNEIVCCRADGGYTRMYMTDRSEILLSKTLGDVEELLIDYHFFRIHNSTLINLKQVKKYIRGEGGEVIMGNGQSLQIARTRKNDFLNVFTRF
ncbi:MAG: LytTR family DNA-binding domain-containing protein [Bacteroidetes bacterium]|nr:LytTR family DNA-binding domain-containing protein [Bacteroidota bacterium]